MGGKCTALLITAGVSLQDNIWNQIVRDRSFAPPPDKKTDILCGLEGYYQKYFGSFVTELNNNYSRLENVTFPSAEIESLAYWLKVQGRINLAKITLLHTKTDSGRKCATIVRDIMRDLLAHQFGQAILERKATASPEVELVGFDFRVDQEASFTSDITAFFDIIEKEIELLKRGDVERIVLNITGGYKILVSLFSLFGFMKEDVEVFYKHENTAEILYAPRLPLSWNFKLFDEYRSLIKRETSLSFEPPFSLTGLFKKEKGVWKMNAYGAAITALYDKEHLKRYGLGTRLMKYLSPQLGKKLTGNIERWIHLWIGDQIPETIEHSRAHSTRLLEYAADLLENVFTIKRDFLSEIELMILLYCFWLHDLGHTGLVFTMGDKKFPVGMFPTLVREWHSFITYRLLMEGDYLPAGEKEAVALICNYHRGKLPLLEARETWRDKVFPDLQVEPLQQISPPLFCQTELPPERMLLLCALLRICDALDVQLDRVVDKYYWEARRRRTREEVSYYWELYEQRKPLMDLCEDPFMTKLLALEKAIIDCRGEWELLADWETAQAVEEKIKQTVEEPLKRLVGQAFGLLQDEENQALVKRELLPLAAEQLSLLDRVAFKMKQEAHFYKHSNVKLVYLTGEGAQFTINMVFAPEVKEQEKVRLAAEIWSELKNDEFDDVDQILKKHGIVFTAVSSEGEKLID